MGNAITAFFATPAAASGVESAGGSCVRIMWGKSHVRPRLYCRTARCSRQHTALGRHFTARIGAPAAAQRTMPPRGAPNLADYSPILRSLQNEGRGVWEMPSARFSPLPPRRSRNGKQYRRIPAIIEMKLNCKDRLSKIWRIHYAEA